MAWCVRAWEMHTGGLILGSRRRGRSRWSDFVGVEGSSRPADGSRQVAGGGDTSFPSGGGVAGGGCDHFFRCNAGAVGQMQVKSLVRQSAADPCACACACV
jgi:hypothetical protein